MKDKVPHAAALPVAEELRDILAPACHRIEIVGSLRRLRPEVGDIELLYVAKTEKAGVPGDMFATAMRDATLPIIERMLEDGTLVKRKNKLGSYSYGAQNKLLLHVPSGIKVDLFSVTDAMWPVSLVVRTGPARLNAEIASRAQHMGLRFLAYGAGFLEPDGRTRTIKTEQEVFETVGLGCRPPHERDGQAECLAGKFL